MSAFTIGIGPNIRKSPYFNATVADGVKCFSVYNHMYIPAHFGDPDGEYDALINGVAMWDVACQRQVELAGPDATRLVQYLVTRDIATTRIGQGRYVLLCNHQGHVINDPVLLKLAEQRYWLSIADSDIELWASAIAKERGWDVDVSEAAAAPLAIQGPKAALVAERLFGDWIHDLSYFGFRETGLDGIPMVLARSGWSKQGGFELYLTDPQRGEELWRRVRAAGDDFGIRPGAPNDAERLESGLLSYGADFRLQERPANPFELGLGKLVHLDKEGGFVGREALAAIAKAGTTRRLAGVLLEEEPETPLTPPMRLEAEGRNVGEVTETAYSPRLGCSIGLAFVAAGLPEETEVTLCSGEQRLSARLQPLPLVEPAA